MNFKKIFRTLVCLVLVCALLVGVSPIKAKASATAASALIASSAAGPVGIFGTLFAMAMGVVFVDMTANAMKGIGESMSVYLYQWGTSAEKLDEVESFLTVIEGTGGDGSGGDGDEGNDFDFWNIPVAILGGLIGWASTLINGEDVEFEEEVIQPALSDCWITGEKTVSATFNSEYSGESTRSFTLTCTTPYIPVIYKFAVGTYVSHQLLVYFGSSSPGTFKIDGSVKTPSVKNSIYYYPIYSNSDTLVGHSFSNAQYFDLGVLAAFGDALPAAFDLIGTRLGEPGEVTTEKATITPGAYVGDIPSQVKNGTFDGLNFELPKINYAAIFQDQSDAIAAVNDVATQLADGSITYNQYITIVNPPPEEQPEETTPEETEPSGEPDPDPTVDSSDSPEGDVNINPDSLANTDAQSFLDNLVNIITAPFKWIWSKIETFFAPLLNPEFLLSPLPEILANPFEWIWEKIETFFAPLLDPDTYLQKLPDILAAPFEWIWGKIEPIPGIITDAISAAADKLEEAIKKLVQPDKDYLTDKVNALCSEFAFADSIVRTAKELKIGLAGVTTEPPVIYIDLGATRGSYDIGGMVPFLDLRWYEEYKLTVDTIISAFLWICFVWRMLIKLPGIISGMPGDFVMASAHHMGVAEHLPTRSKEYEIQRISNREMIRKGLDK